MQSLLKFFYLSVGLLFASSLMSDVYSEGYKPALQTIEGLEQEYVENNPDPMLEEFEKTTDPTYFAKEKENKEVLSKIAFKIHDLALRGDTAYYKFKGLDYNRKATDDEKQGVYRALIRTALSDPSAFSHQEDLSHLIKNQKSYPYYQERYRHRFVCFLVCYLARHDLYRHVQAPILKESDADFIKNICQKITTDKGEDYKNGYFDKTVIPNLAAFATNVYKSKPFQDALSEVVPLQKSEHMGKVLLVKNFSDSIYDKLGKIKMEIRDELMARTCCITSKEISHLEGDFGQAMLDTLFQMTWLKIIDLKSLKIDKLPESIGNLRQLKTLNLYRNELTHLPKSIENLQNTLESLKLSANLLSKDSNETGFGEDKLREIFGSRLDKISNRRSLGKSF